MRSLVLTLDYELYGNGSGDVFKNIIEPTEKLLSLASQYGVRFTFFFEVVEYWKIKKEWYCGNTMGYKDNPVEAIENQIQRAYRQGNDIQLHLHPQWVDARWEDEKWVVNFDKWRLGDYDGFEDNSLISLLKRGKQTLEALLTPIDPNYKCMALRAGGYNIQPSVNIVKAMKEVGLKADSSIYPGGKESGSLSNYDYSSIDPSEGLWQVGERLEIQGDSGIYEIPIVSFPIRNFKKYLTLDGLGSYFYNIKSAKESLDSKLAYNPRRRRIFDIFRYFFMVKWQTWDYCLFPPALHKFFLKKIALLNRDIHVLVGHPKSYTSQRGFEYLLKQTYRKFNYKTISEVLN